MIELEGVLKGLLATHTSALETIDYALAVGDFVQPLASWLGSGVELTTTGAIHCRACGQTTSVSYGQGHCYSCFKSLPSCDICIRSPDRCHFALGTCRDPAWGEANCMRPHLLYLAVSSGVKVGLTNVHNIPRRWLDQGAHAALLIAETRTRHIAGLLEVALAQHVTDRTDWRKMIVDSDGDAAVDLRAIALTLRDAVTEEFAQLQATFGSDAARWRDEDTIWRGRYPRLPGLAVPLEQLRLVANKTLASTLIGIKGQYLLLDHGVLNLRRFAGHQVRIRLGATVAAVPRQASLF